MRAIRTIGLCLLVGAAVSRASATLVVFPTPPGWTAGAPAPGQTASQTFTSINPNDITISLNNNGSSIAGATWASGYPAINSTLLTGGLSGVNGLQLYTTARDSTSSFVLVTVAFASAVTNVSFQLWDVDALAGQFVDQVSQIKATTNSGVTQGASSISSAVAGYNIISGSGLSTIITGTASAANNTNQGTIDISFTGAITQFSFEWRNNDPALGAQAIALGNIDYSVVPEMNATWGIVGLLSLVAAHSRFLTKKSRAVC